MGESLDVLRSQLCIDDFGVDLAEHKLTGCEEVDSESTGTIVRTECQSVIDVLRTGFLVSS